MDNQAAGNGGALDLVATFSPRVSQNLFANNTSSDHGGAVHVESPGTLEDNVFCENHSDGDGGAVQIEMASDVVSNHFLGNTSSGTGAALATSDVTLFANNLVVGNVGAGAVVSGGSLLTLTHGWFLDNLASDDDALTQVGSSYGLDPQLENYAPGNCTGSDFSPTSGSPLIDGEDPGPAHDAPDGTTSGGDGCDLARAPGGLWGLARHR